MRDHDERDRVESTYNLDSEREKATEINAETDYENKSEDDKQL